LHPALIIIRLSGLGLAAGSKYTWVPLEKHKCVPVVGIVQHKLWTPLGKMVYIIGFKKPKASNKHTLPVVAPHWNFPSSSGKQGCIYMYIHSVLMSMFVSWVLVSCLLSKDDRDPLVEFSYFACWREPYIWLGLGSRKYPSPLHEDPHHRWFF
jgi:hypothetical protein